MSEPIEGAISPWMPEQDRLRLAVLGKLGEECSELAARASRCIIHGLDETDPDTGRLNRAELAREAADVAACLDILREVLGVVPNGDRMLGKANGFRRWHRMISAAGQQERSSVEAMAERHLGAP